MKTRGFAQLQKYCIPFVRCGGNQVMPTTVIFKGSGQRISKNEKAKWSCNKFNCDLLMSNGQKKG